MRILQVIAELNRGGAETLLVNILENIDREKYQFDFLVFGNEKYDYEEKIQKLGGNIVRMQKPTEIGMLKFIKEMKQLIKKNQYDVVHAHTLFNCGPCVLAAFLAGTKKRVSHSHNTKYLSEQITFKKKIYYIISKLLINIFSTDCLACGEEAGKFLFYRKFTVIKNGINIEKYKFNEEYRQAIRTELNIPKDSVVIGNIGRLNFQKNQKFLLEIFKNVIEKEENTCMIILGDGELKQQLQSYAEKLEVSSKLYFLGNVPDANRYYSTFDVFVFPSLFEGLPYTLIEAQCNGVPIIASDTISTESNLSNKISFLKLEDNVETWRDKTIQIAKNRYECIDDIIKSGYSIKDTVHVVEKIWEE